MSHAAGSDRRKRYMDSNTSDNRRPDGWPRWLWRLVMLFVAPEHRTELMAPDQRAKTARALAEKLTRSQKEWNGWRNRALSAERCVAYELRQAIKAACVRHDKEHSTTLSWHV